MIIELLRTGHLQLFVIEDTGLLDKNLNDSTGDVVNARINTKKPLLNFGETLLLTVEDDIIPLLICTTGCALANLMYPRRRELLYTLIHKLGAMGLTLNLMLQCPCESIKGLLAARKISSWKSGISAYFRGSRFVPDSSDLRLNFSGNFT